MNGIDLKGKTAIVTGAGEAMDLKENQLDIREAAKVNLNGIRKYV